MSNGVKKKKKDEFQEFRNNEKSAYKTFKIPLKTILLNYNTHHHKENEKVKQNVINEFYYMKERKMELLKKKHNCHFKIANQLIMINSKCILLKRIN